MTTSGAAGVNRRALDDEYLADQPGAARAQLVLHLHRLDHHHALPRDDLVAGLAPARARPCLASAPAGAAGPSPVAPAPWRRPRLAARRVTATTAPPTTTSTWPLGPVRGHRHVVLPAGARLAQRVAARTQACDVDVDRLTVQRDGQCRASGLHRHRPHATADFELEPHRYLRRLGACRAGPGAARAAAVPAAARSTRRAPRRSRPGPRPRRPGVANGVPFRCRQRAVEKRRVDARGQEVLVVEQPGEKRNGRLDAGDLVLGQRAPHAGDGLGPARAPRDQLRDQRVVVNRHLARRIVPAVVAHAGTRWRTQPGQPARRRQEARSPDPRRRCGTRRRDREAPRPCAGRWSGARRARVGTATAPGRRR